MFVKGREISGRRDEEFQQCQNQVLRTGTLWEEKWERRTRSRVQHFHGPICSADVSNALLWTRRSSLNIAAVLPPQDPELLPIVCTLFFQTLLF